MEQARIATSQTTASASTARGKHALSGKNDGQNGVAGSGDFSALLGFLDEGGMEAELTVNGVSASEEDSDTSQKPMGLVQESGEMPWLLAVNATLSPLSLVVPTSSGQLQERNDDPLGRIGVSVGSLSLNPAPSFGVDAGIEVFPAVQAAVPTTPLGLIPVGERLVEKLIQQAGEGVPVGSVGSLVSTASLNLATALDGEAALSNGLPGPAAMLSETAVDQPPVLSSTTNPASYQSTLDHVQETTAGVWRGKNSGPNGISAKGSKPGIVLGEGTFTVSTTVAPRMVERTVDLGQAVMREVRIADEKRAEFGIERESLSAENGREPNTLSLVPTGLDAGDMAGQPGPFTQDGFASNSHNGAVIGSDNPSVFQGDTFGLSAEERVADQVSQWVGQTIHNAELTVDRDGHAVHVTVTMSGQDAHVAFRTDEGQTRALLDAHLAELGELLRNQGLQLSGAWVGTSQQQSGRDRSSAFQSTASLGKVSSTESSVAVSPSLSSNLRATHSVAGQRSLDIFV